MTRRLTGLQPTGHLHLGNLLGGIAPIVDGQHDAESIIMIVDLHALTVEHDPAALRRTTLDMVAVLLAAGIDPACTPIIATSQIPEHTELHYLLECTAGYGEAARMIQFKEKSRSEKHVRLSLLTYPVLMAADILLYDVGQVPVGEDQNQHLELARTLATRFNARYGTTFTVPEGVRTEAAARIMDLADPTRKMSKSGASAAGRIGLLDPPETIRKTVSRAVTDTLGVVRADTVNQPGVANLLSVLTACTGTPARPEEFTSYGQLKKEVVDAVDALLAPIRARHADLTGDPAYLRSILAEGKTRVRPLASATVRRTKGALGLLEGN